MWNNPKAFISFIPETEGGYVKLANNARIPIVGSGTIRVIFYTSTLEIDDVFYVLSLINSLYSIKQHIRNPHCAFHCAYEYGCKLLYPHFTIPINDNDEFYLPCARPPPSTKVHWTNIVCHKKALTVQLPKLQPHHKPNPSQQNSRCITNHELHRYIGYCNLQNMDDFKQAIQNTITIVNVGELPKGISLYTTIKCHKHNTNLIPHPSQFFDVVHIDIGYGDTIVPGGFKFCLLIVDCKTRYSFIFGLKDTKASSIITALRKLHATTGMFPKQIYTDFDSKLLSSPVLTYCTKLHCQLHSCPEGQQNQNGLVEQKWQTLVHMAHRFLMDKQMSRSFWFWAIYHTNRISNIFPLKCDGQITISHELVSHPKPDYRQLFQLFSTVYLSHKKDGIHNCTTFISHSLQGFAVGYSHIANGMEIYNPINKQLHTTTVFKLDEDNAIMNHFNLHYDGSMFFGLYSSNNHRNYAEPFPPGTAVQFQRDSSKDPLQGYVVAVPDVKFTEDTTTYLVCLDDGSIGCVPAALLQHWSASSTASSEAATASPYPS